MKTLIQEIARNCQWHKTVNDNFIDQCEENIKKLEDFLPSGSGIDAGCKIDIENSGTKKVVITFGYHHMNENGYYDGWTNHILTVYPTFAGIEMEISGKDKNQVKDYLYDFFYTELNCLVEI